MKKMTRKLFAVLLAGTMTVSATGLSALALDVDISLGDVTISSEDSKTSVSHTAKNEDGSTEARKNTLAENESVHVTQSEEGPTNNTIKVETDAKVVLDNVNIAADDGESAVEIAAGATADITLKGDNILQGGTNGAGIAVPGGATLTLGSDKEGGTLTAIGNAGHEDDYREKKIKTSGAGIGGTASQGTSGTKGTSGTINIVGLQKTTTDEDGNKVTTGLTAQGYGVHASGIGSALDGSSGAITITGSTIDKVTGGYVEDELKSRYGNDDLEGGAAIGGGGKGGKCGNITIENSTITSAYGGSKATAIGGSCWADVDDINITNSTLKYVEGGSSSAGIGVGRVNEDSASANANITIEKSTVNVKGGEYGAGIGTGYNGDSIGNQNATDWRKDAELASTTITIQDSTVTAVGGNGGAGIGGGYKGWNTNIDIQGSTVYAQSGIVHNEDENGNRRYSMSVYTERVKNGASAIGTGANGSGKFEGGTIAIEGGATVIAVSNGGKWAIDLTCDVSGVVSGYQNMFLSDGKETTFSGDQIQNPEDKCETVPYKKGYTVIMNGQKIVLPTDFLCAAVTTGGVDGVFHTTNEDGTWYFSHYGFVDSDSKDTKAAYGSAADMADLEQINHTKTVEMTVTTGKLADNSYLHVALRAGDEVPAENPGGDPGENPGGDPGDNPGTNPGKKPDKTPDTDPEETGITDPEVPMTDLPSEEIPADETPAGELTDLPDQDVPLSEVPRTGDVSALWLAMTVLSGCALMGLAFLSFRKRKEA